jgi:hypothetical protein
MLFKKCEKENRFFLFSWNSIAKDRMNRSYPINAINTVYKAT